MFGSVFLPVFLAIGSIFELESAISDVFAVFAAFWNWNLIVHRFCNILVEFVTIWSWKLPFLGYLHVFDFEPFIVNGICNIFGAGTVHVTWSFRTRVHVGLV